MIKWFALGLYLFRPRKQEAGETSAIQSSGWNGTSIPACPTTKFEPGPAEVTQPIDVPEYVHTVDDRK